MQGFAPKGGNDDEKNLPAQEDPSEERAWLPQENGYQKWPQGFGSQTFQRKSPLNLLGYGHTLLWPFFTGHRKAVQQKTSEGRRSGAEAEEGWPIGLAFSKKRPAPGFCPLFWRAVYMKLLQRQMHVEETLNRNHQFRLIYKKGRSSVHPVLVTYVMKNRTRAARMAVVSSKKIGNAVKRNRARRVVRAAYRDCGFSIPAGWDVIFVCRAKTAFVKSTAVVPVMRRQLQELFAQPSGAPL